MDEQKEKQTKELLEVLEKALRSEAVERITITIKPNQKPSSPKGSAVGKSHPPPLLYPPATTKSRRRPTHGNHGKGKL